ncbi:glycosyltransferase family 2 protein [Peribacillus muralis]|uniref:glycosyltransferase family 2 protein n=1 Tax=Peribacillus muralis TaxID=264697 RepID=UPI001F4E9D06|nr:glycosyltransferase family A protein [Peribacillus muralis]MCK1992336.1 glycosyltransferase family 2 protein [Peribacillus muralis]MCK2012892.1 glycosyltransferase family 2 protein [Peribacillus muralis]
MRKVTVGIPCYNESENILKCLDSITSQTDIFQDIEVLIVDDGSTDDTVKIIEDYKKQYKKKGSIKILTQENTGGPSTARNRIIDEAKGEYIFFVDADDYLGEHSISNMYTLGKDSDSDVIIGKYEGVNRRVPVYVFKSTQINTNFFDSLVKDTMSVLKMFKTEYLRSLDIRFRKDIRMAEDHPVAMSAYLHTKKISIYADSPCYYWVRHVNTEHRTHLTGGVIAVDEFYKYLFETFEVIKNARITEKERTEAYRIYWDRLLSLDIVNEFKRNRTEPERHHSFAILLRLFNKYEGAAITPLLTGYKRYTALLLCNEDYLLFTEYLKIK